MGLVCLKVVPEAPMVVGGLALGVPGGVVPLILLDSSSEASYAVQIEPKVLESEISSSDPGVLAPWTFPWEGR